MPAIAALRRAMNQDDNMSVAVQAAKDILDRTGYRPIEKVEQATDVRITVSYADDVGLLPVVAPPGARQNRVALGDGQQSV